MLFFKVIFEFNFRVMFSEYLLETLNNANDIGLIKFRTNPNDNTGYPIHEDSFLSEVYLLFRYTFKNGGRQDFFR
jgi:hypothetical protein